MAMTRLLILAALAAPAAWAQPEQDMMAAYMAAAAPDEHHERLAQFAGTRTFTMTHWPGPGAPSQSADGTVSAEMIMGGRYLVARYSSDMGGFVFEGSAWTGYDRTAGEYVSTWIDNMSTTIMVARGQESDGVMEMRGEYVDPVTRAHQVHRSVERLLPDGGYRMEYYVREGDGEEWKSMEIVYSPPAHNE
jgi:hypothetical protein